MDFTCDELTWIRGALLEVITGGGEILESELPIRVGGDKAQLSALFEKVEQIRATRTDD